MKIFVAGHYYDKVHSVFAARGHDITYMDIPCVRIPGMIQNGDLLSQISSDYDMVIIHPDCQFLIYNCQNRYVSKPSRLNILHQHCDLFNSLLELSNEKVVIENPELNSFAKSFIHKEPDQVLATNETGRNICFWLKGLPKLPVENTELMKSADRYEYYNKLIEIMAGQWL